MHIIFTLFSVSLLHHFAGKTWPQSTRALSFLLGSSPPEVISHTSRGKMEVSEHTSLPGRRSLQVLMILYVSECLWLWPQNALYQACGKSLLCFVFRFT